MTPHDSFWVVPGRLLAGPYPGDRSPEIAREKVSDFLTAGLNVFVDLTEEGELERYDDCIGVARHHRLPIRDVDIPTVGTMRLILSTITAALEAGDVVYVHCWGGVGRTGTVVGCLLREHGLDADAALQRIRALRAGTDRAHRESPETPEQRRFVARWTPTSDRSA